VIYCVKKHGEFYHLKTEIWKAAKLLLAQLLKLDINEQLVLEVDYWKAENQVLKNQLTNHTPLRKNMKDNRPKEFVKIINNKRKLVEIVIGQLTERFNIEKVIARDMWHLTIRIGRKLLAHTVNCFINYTLGNSILQFERIVL
jgi:hypothetical protein